jgi:tRNA(fMet)-specific endonuclease VapC
VIVLDTDHLSVVIDRRAAQHVALVAKLSGSGTPLATSIVSVEEQCRGWLAQINRVPEVRQQVSAYDHLGKLFEFLNGWTIVPFDVDAADRFEVLRKQKVRVGTQDLKIASIVLVRDAMLLSANLKDFRRVPDLRVENWLQEPAQTT